MEDRTFRGGGLEGEGTFLSFNGRNGRFGQKTQGCDPPGPGREEDSYEGCDSHGSNDHFASIYESREDQFETVVPFLKEGLEEGERCLYVADDNTEEEVLEALREGGVKVDAAIESGALSIHTKDDTYLRTGDFETEKMLEFWQETLADARDNEGFSGVRAAAEMTWALDEASEDRGILDQLVEYEALLNNLYSGEDYVVLCQYSRERFPDEVLSDVIQSHPFVVHNGTACSNHQYHPPEEFFETGRPPLDVDRTIEGLLGRAQTRQTLQKRERFQRALYEITSNPECSFEEKLDLLFELGCEFFGMEFGGLARVDSDTDFFEVETISSEHSHLIPGKEYSLSETYCLIPAEKGGTASVSDPVNRGFEGKLCYEKFGVRAYLSTLIELEEAFDRIFFFVSDEPKEEPFSEAERTFHHLMGQWVEQEHRRKRREEDLKELNETLEEQVEERTRQVRELTAKITLAEQRERDRIARLLHDGLQQRLYGSQLKVQLLRTEAVAEGQEALAGRIQKVEGEIEEVAAALRQLSVGMSPPVLEGEGLKGALEWLQSHMEKTHGLGVDLQAEEEFHVEEEMRALLFRAVKELLGALAECSEAKQATVALRKEKGNLVIEVVGEGESLDPETLRSQGLEEGLSFKGACERLCIFGGELRLKAGREKQARAEIRVPIKEKSPEYVPLEGEGQNEAADRTRKGKQETKRLQEQFL